MAEQKDIFEKFAELRALYPDDIKRIEADEQAARALLNKKGYAMLDTTKELLALCRKDILGARIKLATTRDLNDDARRELWAIIDARLWFVQMVTQDYDAELATMDAQLDAELLA
jgi:hypothetical protein